MTVSAKVTFPDGRTATVTGPDRDTVVARVNAIRNPQIGGEDTQNRETPIGSVFDFSRGINAGVRNFGSGVKQLMGIADPEVQAEEQANIARQDAKLDELGGIAKAGGFVGEVAPSMALPGGSTTGGILRRVITGAAADTAATVADPVREGQTRSGNLQTAAAFSAGSRSLGGTAASAFQRFANARSGNIANDQVRELIQEADANEISLFLDDVSGSPLAKKASVAAESFGIFGTARGRERQGQEALAAAERWLARVSGDNDNYQEVIQGGVGRKLRLFQEAASRKYERVAREIGDAGEVATPSFQSAARRGVITEIQKGTRGNDSVVEFLERYRYAPRGNFDEMIEFRSDFNKEMGDFIRDTSLGRSSIDALRKAQEALDNDLASFARANGAESSWRAANDFYRRTVAQFKVGKLKALTDERSSANFDESAAWRYLAQNSANSTRARKMFTALDRQGREAVRFGLIKEAFDAATNEGRPFSPARFAGALERRMPVAEEFFRGRSGQELKGLVRVMRHVERAGQFAENPPTGNRLLVPLLAGGAAVDAGTTTGLVGGSLAIKQLFQTETGRNLFYAANQATPGSQRFSEIVEKIERLVARSSQEERTR